MIFLIRLLCVFVANATNLQQVRIKAFILLVFRVPSAAPYIENRYNRI